MMKVKKSEYITHSRTLVRKLFSSGCFGTGSMYETNLLSGLPNVPVAKAILKALVKQKIIIAKRKKFGWKFYLNRERIDKIKQIVKEQGRDSIIPMLILL